ncbi:MAG: hypothetical protein K2J93_07015 [Anaeroplasmataceae bacterium]|nr:hypothetical protein [Anaeroplasmataceae bacterium]
MKNNKGLVLRIIHSFLAVGIGCTYFFLFGKDMESIRIIGYVFWGYAVICFCLSILGRRYKIANFLMIILAGLIVPIGILGLIGGILGYQSFSNMSLNKKATEAQEPSKETITKSILKQSILERTAVITFSFGGETKQFKEIDYYLSKDTTKKLYVLLEEVDSIATDVYVGVYNENLDCVEDVPDEIAQEVFALWKSSLYTPTQSTNSSTDSSKRKKSNVLAGVKFYDSIISRKDWKAFRRSASQDDLAILAIGAKYRVFGFKPILKAIISVAGVIASIALGIYGLAYFGQFALFAMVGGFFFFNVLATKLIGYTDTYDSCYRKLNKDLKKYVNQFYNTNLFLELFNILLYLALTIFTFPYKMLLLVIEIMIPKAKEWAICKGNGESVVVTIPEGFDIGNLGALGEYYKSFTFGDVWDAQIEENKRIEMAKYSKYEYNGKTAYSKDGKTFYDSPDSSVSKVVGYSEDGKTIYTKDE